MTIEYASAYHRRPVGVLAEAQRRASATSDDGYADALQERIRRGGGLVGFNKVTRRFYWHPVGAAASPASRAKSYVASASARRARLERLEAEIRRDAAKTWGEAERAQHARSLRYQTEPVLTPRLTPRQRLDEIERQLRPAPTRWR